MKRPPLPVAAAILLLGGMGLLFLSEATLLQVFAVFVMAAGIACGVFSISSPDFLGREPDEAEMLDSAEDH
jgi:hypothetical protein